MSTVRVSVNNKCIGRFLAPKIVDAPKTLMEFRDSRQAYLAFMLLFYITNNANCKRVEASM